MKRGRDDGLPPGGIKRPARPAPQTGQSHRLTTNDALTYLREVKNKFADKKEVYDTFLEIMKEFKAQRIDTAGVIIRVKELFRGHKMLVLGFNTFLPKGYEIKMADVADMDSEPEDGAQGPSSQAKQPVEFDQAISYVNKIKNRFANDERVYKAFLEILNMYRKGNKSISQVYDEVAVLFKNHHDLLTEFTYFLPDNSPPGPGGAHPLLQRVGINTPWQPPNRNKPYGGAGGRMVMPGGGARYAPGGGGYGQGLPYNKRKAGRPEHGRAEEEVGGRATQLERELQFFERVKARIRNKEAYQEFLKCLNLFAADVISKGELLSLVGDVLNKYPELLQGFHNFLGRCESMHSFEDDWRAITQSQRAFGRDVGRTGKGQLKDKYFSKPISEVAAELNPDDRCTTSYVRVPSGFPRLTCSGRNALHHEVLNDSWVSIISGSEDYSFKLMRKNQYEEALFRCEDDRYELDMHIETNASTINRLRPLVEAFAAMTPEEKVNYRLPDTLLGPIHFRAVERIYGDSQGPNVVDLLKKNPTVAIPVVLHRLEQKDVEWRKAREHMNGLWRKVFEQNYNKSLDHRSFYFKQADKKSLLPKTMTQEIRDAAEKRRSNQSQLMAFAVGAPVSVCLQPPDLSFDYADRSVFEDVYQVVIYAVEEGLQMEGRENVLKFWHNIVELFFGREQRTYARLHLGEPEELHEAPESSSEEAPAGAGKEEDGADFGGAGGDAQMTDAGATPEPGTTPEPADKGDKDALEVLLAAGQAELSEQDEGADKREGTAKAADEASDGSTDSTDEEANRFYDVCKPVCGQPQLKAAGAEEAAPQVQKQHLMYGNDNLYLFFRYHWHLFDRLNTAQRCAREKNQPQQYSAWQAAGSEAQRTPEREQTATQREEAKQLHGEFMGMVRNLLDGKLDSGVFEDQCRQLLGTNSYMLFTLDKLVYKFVKHMQAMTADEQTMRLLELHLYERARHPPLSDEIYRANASVIINDDTCYRFEYQEGTSAAAAATAAAGSSSSSSAQLQIQLLDTDKNETQLLSLEPAFTTYIKSYLCSSAGLKQGKVFAQRCMRRTKGVAADEDPRLMEALHNVYILNGLEGKIGCASSKASYVLDTEDIFFRPRAAPKQPSAAAAAKRQARWEAWYEPALLGLLQKRDDTSLKDIHDTAPAVAQLGQLAATSEVLQQDRVMYPPQSAAAYQQAVMAALAGVGTRQG